ncbi:MAG TPA: hypothetical protein DCL15_19100, partial [Chloroflexi bacterium]|nr:hypothetical protein [Chloroflexota bacterium]
MSNLPVLIQRLRRTRRLRFALAVLLVFSLIAGDLAPRLSMIQVWAQPPSPTVTAPVLSLTVPAAPQPAHTAFEVQVRVSGGANLGGFEFDLNYDPVLVAVTAITPTALLGGGAGCDPTAERCVGALGPHATPGGVAVGAFSFGAVNTAAGDGVLATLRVQPTGRSGATALAITNAVLASADASVTTPLVQNAELELAAPAPAMRTLYMPLVARQSASNAGAENALYTTAALT